MSTRENIRLIARVSLSTQNQNRNLWILIRWLLQINQKKVIIEAHGKPGPTSVLLQ